MKTNSFKVFKLDGKKPDVLLYRDVNNDGEDIVVIKIYGFQHSDDEENLCEENIRFDNADAAKRYIRDFSKESAEEFLEEFGLKIDRWNDDNLDSNEEEIDNETDD